MPTLDHRMCSVCAHDINSPACPHPWKQPFEKWPAPLRNQLKQLAPHGFDPDPPEHA